MTTLIETGRPYLDTNVISAELQDDGTLVILRRRKSNMRYGNGEPVPDDIYKETYAAIDGKIQLVNTVKGKHTPACLVAESFEFPE